MNMLVLDTSSIHNLNDQNREELVNNFYIQLIFLFLDVIDLYGDLLFEQLLHSFLKLVVKHHAQLDVEDQNLL
eukprot:scaffold51.g5968.t1